jgi:hypothetical protein
VGDFGNDFIGKSDCRSVGLGVGLGAGFSVLSFVVGLGVGSSIVGI